MVKHKGLECLASEQSKVLMRMLADTMSQVAEQTWGSKDKWIGLLETMHSFITSNDPRLIEVALVLFSKLTEWLGQDPVLQNMQRQMYDVLLKFLQEAPNDDVRIAACKAATNFILVRLCGPSPVAPAYQSNLNTIPCCCTTLSSAVARRALRKPTRSAPSRL
jgi:hypothetical protein